MLPNSPPSPTAGKIPQSKKGPQRKRGLHLFSSKLWEKKTQPLRQLLRLPLGFFKQLRKLQTKKTENPKPLDNPEIFDSPGPPASTGRDFAVAAPRAEGTERWQLRCPQEGRGTVPRRAGGRCGSLPCRVRMKMMKIQGCHIWGWFFYLKNVYYKKGMIPV